MRGVTEGMGQESTCALESQSRSSVKETGDSKLLGRIIIFSGLGRNTNYSLPYQNIEICFIKKKKELGIHRLLRSVKRINIFQEFHPHPAMEMEEKPTIRDIKLKLAD